MKLIHTADLHLDSKLIGLERRTAELRRQELLLTFGAMIRYAKEKEVEGFIIAGDLFDEPLPSLKAREEVRELFLSSPEITFFLLSGNHDGKLPHSFLTTLPDNVKLFGEAPSRYSFGEGVTVGGACDLSQLSEMVPFDNDKINIFIAHGAPVRYGSEGVRLSQLEDKNIDYLALGHYHSYSSESFGRGVWCMSGTPEGRGYDETGKKGFVLINIENNKLSHEFIPFSKRCIYDITVDVTNVARAEIFSLLKLRLRETGVTSEDFYRVSLCGKTSAMLDAAFLARKLKEENAAFEGTVTDKTVFDTVDESEISLYTEFKKQVYALALSQEDQSEVLKLGYEALYGKD